VAFRFAQRKTALAKPVAHQSADTDRATPPELFRQRWEIETNFGHLKTTMKMDVLKCKTVDGVLKELQVFALIYNLVRQVMLQAAGRQRVDVRRISFIDALRWLQSASRR